MTPNGANALSFIDADYILTERGCMYHGIQMGRGDTDRLLLKEATAETYSLELWDFPPSARRQSQGAC